MEESHKIQTDTKESLKRIGVDKDKPFFYHIPVHGSWVHGSPHHLNHYSNYASHWYPQKEAGSEPR